MLSDFLKDYLPIIIFLVIALGLSSAFVLINFILAPNNPDPEKLSAYECGFEPFEDSRMEFDVRFYLVAILFIILSLLGTIGATLTLPGIAGIVLTIGMAVDANVLIFERIKEENTRNDKALLAIKNGFDRALSTILDANITTLIAALLLFIFGSGPIKGFSITLSLGILSSMFSAIMFTNLLIYIWYSFSRKREISL